jgi:hypothetical protein
MAGGSLVVCGTDMMDNGGSPLDSLGAEGDIVYELSIRRGLSS